MTDIKKNGKELKDDALKNASGGKGGYIGRGSRKSAKR
jgi:hypothetical protein